MNWMSSYIRQDIGFSNMIFAIFRLQFHPLISRGTFLHVGGLLSAGWVGKEA